MYVYSVFDKKVAAYGQPFFAQSDSAASRMVSMASMDRNSLLRTFPADYTLELIGEWDDQVGELKPSKPRTVCPVASLVIGGNDGEASDNGASPSPKVEVEKKSTSS